MKALRTILASLMLAAFAGQLCGQPAFTEIIEPNPRAGSGFGWLFGGLPDLTRDGVGEFYALGALGRCYVYDGAKIELLYTLLATTNANSCGFFSGAQSAGDLTGDGVPELMLGGACGFTFYRVQLFDGATGTHLFNLNAPTVVNQGFFGQTLRLLPDMTDDGREDWLIHQPEYQSRVGRVYIYDSQTTNVVRVIQNAEPEYRFWMNVVEVIPDVDRDRKPELLVGGDGRAVVRSLETGSVLYEIQRPEPLALAGPANVLKGVGDITGDGIGDIAIGNFAHSNNTGVVYFFNGTNGQWLRTLRSPSPRVGGKFGRVIEVLTDLNGDGVAEIWIQEDEFDLTYIFDGATSALLKTIQYPGAFATLFFTGIVRQQAAPGVRGYLFASEFVHNAEGRVYFMPFTPIQPTQLKAMGKNESGFRLHLTGEPGLRLEIQATSDFTTWNAVTNVTTGTGGVEIQDSTANGRAQRFYRTVLNSIH